MMDFPARARNQVSNNDPAFTPLGPGRLAKRMACALLALAVWGAVLAPPAMATVEPEPAGRSAKTAAQIEKGRRKNRNRRQAAATQRRILDQEAAARRWDQSHPPSPPPAPEVPVKAASTPGPLGAPYRFSSRMAVLGTAAAYFSSTLARETVLAPAGPEAPSLKWNEVLTFAPPRPDAPGPSARGEVCPSGGRNPVWDVAAPPAVCPATLEPFIVLALYNPANGGSRRDFTHELARTGVEKIEILGEMPDLSSIALDGEVILSAHGEPGYFNDGERRIAMTSVVAALTDGQRGLPEGFHGKVTVWACSAGEVPDKPVPPFLLDDVRDWLELSGVTDPSCVQSILAAITEKRTVFRKLEKKIRARLRKDAADHPSSTRYPVDHIMEFFRDTIGKDLQPLRPGSAVEQVADALAAAGYVGIEVSGPVSTIFAFESKGVPTLEVVIPGTRFTLLTGLLQALQLYYEGKIAEPARSRIVAMGVDPKYEGAANGPLPARCFLPPLPGPKGIGLIQHVTQLQGCARAFDDFVHETLLTLDLTEAIGQPKVFLPPSERFVTVTVGHKAKALPD